jgi:2-polyprenyl-6-methoxyphenol hydroxylase-like FAD-dependent oxidoreductase
MRRKTALISGAGVAGPAAAYWLNAAGWRTTIIERAPSLRTGGYVVDFWGLGYELAERMGLSDAIRAAGYHVREVRVIGERGQRLAGFGTDVFQELTRGRFITLARSDLSRLILEAAAPATELLFGDEIAALSPDAHGVDVQLASGSQRRVDLVIGADGLHSRVRQLAFGPEKTFEKPFSYAVAAFETRAYCPRDPDVYLMYGEPGRMLGRFTLRGDRSMFLFIFDFEGELPTDTGGQKALLEALYRGGRWETEDILARLSETADLYFDRVSQIIAPAWSRGRIGLVGDAAFCVSLLAGQGSALAIIAAYVLAGEIARANGDIVEGLTRYERRLRPYIAAKQAGAARLAGAFAPRTRFGLWFRNRVMEAIRAPAIAKLVAGREILDRIELPEYPLTAQPRPAAAPADSRPGGARMRRTP